MMNTIFEIRHTETKGYGVFAKKAILRNTIILNEKPILTVTKPAIPGKEAADANIEEAFRKLSTRDQNRILELHEGKHHSSGTKASRILHANAFADEPEEKLFLTTSRFNHSCVPNASFRLEAGEGRVRTEKDIAFGEEITFSYLPPFIECMTALQRATVLRLHYGFECRCTACGRWESDARRQLINFLSNALKGQRPLDFSPFDQLDPMAFVNYPPKPMPSKNTLTACQKIEYNFLLANLREAEGLQHSSIVDCYLEAASLLLQQQAKLAQDDATRYIVFLEAGRCMQAWYEKAIAIDKAWYRKDFKKVRGDGENFWRSAQCLQMLRMVEMMPMLGLPAATKRREDFAVCWSTEEADVSWLSREGCEELVKGRVKRR